jgi:hypothetical protein
MFIMQLGKKGLKCNKWILVAVLHQLTIVSVDVGLKFEWEILLKNGKYTMLHQFLWVSEKFKN